MRQLGPTAALALLAGCGQASAAIIDPADDVHCSILAFYYHGLAEHHAFPVAQRKAAKGVSDWYAAKMRLVAKERWGDMTGFEKEAAPLLEAVKADPEAMLDELVACTTRAASDPAFNKHARSYR